MLRLFREANKASAKLEVEASRPLWRPWRLVPIDSDSEVEASDVVSMMVSMTSLLTHNVAHFTRHSFRPKTNNQQNHILQ